MAVESTEKGAPVERLPETGISVLIVGAGVGGICAALECWRKGHHVRIIEKSNGPDVQGKAPIRNMMRMYNC